jgi:hypothetical protein
MIFFVISNWRIMDGRQDACLRLVFQNDTFSFFQKCFLCNYDRQSFIACKPYDRVQSLWNMISMSYNGISTGRDLMTSLTVLFLFELSLNFENNIETNEAEAETAKLLGLIYQPVYTKETTKGITTPNHTCTCEPSRAVITLRIHHVQ